MNGRDKDPQQDQKDSVALFLKYPFQASRSIQAHLKLLGYASYVKRYQWKSPNTAIVVVSPPSMGDNIVSNVHGTKISGKYELNVNYYQPRYEKKRQGINQRSITASGHCKLFIGSGLPRHTNEQHLRDHFEEFEQWITNVEIVRDRFTNDCKGYGYVTFSTIEIAREAKAALYHSKLMGVRVNVNFRTSSRQLPIGDRIVQEDQQAEDSDSIATVVVKTNPHLPSYVSSSDLKSHFKGFESDIANAYVIKDVTHQYSLGAGVVQFSSVKAADYATEKMINTKILGEYKIVDLYIDDESSSSNDGELDYTSEPPSPQIKPRVTTLESPKDSFAEVETLSSAMSSSNTVQDMASRNVACDTQELEGSHEKTCVIIKNLSPNLMESEISSLIAVPMITCKRFSPSSDIFIKCHTAADASSIVKKLHNKKYLRKVISVQLVAEEDPQTQSEPSVFRATSSYRNPIKPQASIATTPEDTSFSRSTSNEGYGITYSLSPQEWNLLMLANPKTKVLLYNEIKEPFKNNPDIVFHPDPDQQCLRLSGKHGAVEDARSFLVRKLKQEIPMDDR